MARLIVTSALLFGVACATTSQPMLSFSLSEESFGLYEKREEQTVLLEETEDIPCQLGVTFGAKVVLELSSDSGGRVPLDGEVYGPRVEDPRPVLKQILPDPLVAPKGVNTGSILATSTFDDPDQLVDGEYLLRLYETSTQEILYERTFRVSDCP